MRRLVRINLVVTIILFAARHSPLLAEESNGLSFSTSVGRIVPGRDGGQWRSLRLITGGHVDAAWAQVGWGGFAVDGDALRTACDDRGMGLLVYKPEKFGDCQIRVVYRCEKPKSNSGVFVRIDDGILARIGDKSPEVHRDAKGKLSPQMIDQNHDPGDVVWFKEVSVRPLDGAE